MTENTLKENRIKMITDCLLKIEEIQELYQGAHPAWVLIRAARGHVQALRYLEAESNFDDETLGVKFKP